jgi:hypothetical protein
MGRHKAGASIWLTLSRCLHRTSEFVVNYQSGNAFQDRITRAATPIEAFVERLPREPCRLQCTTCLRKILKTEHSCRAAERVRFLDHALVVRRTNEAGSSDGGSPYEAELAALKPYSKEWWSVRDAIDRAAEVKLAKKLIICRDCMPSEPDDQTGSIAPK